jgi:hypothetical protein
MQKHIVLDRFRCVREIGAAEMKNTFTAADFFDKVQPLD